MPPRTLNPTSSTSSSRSLTASTTATPSSSEIEQRTLGALRLGPASLYQSIQKLERDGFIKNANQPIDYPGARLNQRHYRLTDEGRVVLRRELDRLERIVAYGRSRPGFSGEPS